MLHMKNMDEKSYAILRCLVEDARLSARQVSAQTDLSPPAVLDRIRRMEDQGIITGYQAQINLTKLGLPISAFIRLTARDGHCEKTLSAISQTPETLETYHVAGETDYLIRVAVQDIESLQKLVTRLSQVGAVSTEIILDTPIRRTGLSGAPDVSTSND